MSGVHYIIQNLEVNGNDETDIFNNEEFYDIVFVPGEQVNLEERVKKYLRKEFDYSEDDTITFSLKKLGIARI